jgi:hypothetical protein
MKVITQITEIEKEGLLALIGKKVLVLCMNYFYTGELVGVNDTCIKLKNCHQVMETGSHKDAHFKDAQWIGENWYIQTSAIESFGETIKTV